MKLPKRVKSFGRLKSPLAMAEWIEIRKVKSVLPGTRVSASDGGVD